MTHEPTCGIIEVNGTLTVDDLAKHQARYMPTHKGATTMQTTTTSPAVDSYLKWAMPVYGYPTRATWVAHRMLEDHQAWFTVRKLIKKHKAKGHGTSDKQIQRPLERILVRGTIIDPEVLPHIHWQWIVAHYREDAVANQ